jgi:hypothetical protein
MTAKQRETIQAVEMKRGGNMPMTIDPVELNDVEPAFGREHWTCIAQIKVERTSVDAQIQCLVMNAPEKLVRFLAELVKESDLGSWAVSGSNHNFITSDKERIFRVVSTSCLEGSVLVFDTNNPTRY